MEFRDCSFALEEILYDAQTSGGLLVAMDPQDVQKAYEELEQLGLPCAIVGRVTDKGTKTIIVE